MSYIRSYCTICPGIVCLNGKDYLKIKRKPVGMNDFFSALYSKLKIDYRKFYKMDALSKLGFLASEIVLTGSDREQPKQDVGIIFFNKSSSLEADGNFQKTIRDKENFFPSPAEFVHTLPNIVTGEIAIRNKIYGETMFYVVSGCYGERLSPVIEDTMKFAGLKCALVGWVEVDALKNTFECLMMLCTSKSNSNLPTGLTNVYAGEKIPTDMNNIRTLYFNKIKKQ